MKAKQQHMSVQVQRVKDEEEAKINFGDVLSEEMRKKNTFEFNIIQVLGLAPLL